jgi:hypothetical protein
MPRDQRTLSPVEDGLKLILWVFTDFIIQQMILLPSTPSGRENMAASWAINHGETQVIGISIRRARFLPARLFPRRDPDDRAVRRLGALAS